MSPSSTHPSTALHSCPLLQHLSRPPSLWAQTESLYFSVTIFLILLALLPTVSPQLILAQLPVIVTTLSSWCFLFAFLVAAHSQSLTGYVRSMKILVPHIQRKQILNYHSCPQSRVDPQMKLQSSASPPLLSPLPVFSSSYTLINSHTEVPLPEGQLLETPL